jgi:hypothetical protein
VGDDATDAGAAVEDAVQDRPGDGTVGLDGEFQQEV